MKPEGRLRLKCDGTRAETRFRLSAKRTSPFKLAGASVYSTTGNRVVRISCSNVGYTMSRGSMKSSVSQCVIVCHHISTGLYHKFNTPPGPPSTPSWEVAGIYTAPSLKGYSTSQDVASVKRLLRSSTSSLYTLITDHIVFGPVRLFRLVSFTISSPKNSKRLIDNPTNMTTNADCN